jgi:hypothetical protein
LRLSGRVECKPSALTAPELFVDGQTRAAVAPEY